MKKRTILAILAVTIMMVTIVTAADVQDTGSNLRMLTEDVNPEPVEPGQDVSVTVRLHNYGGAASGEFEVKLNVEPPFYLKTESQNFEGINSMCVGCSYDNTYYLAVDSNAVSGIYPIRFEIYEDGGNTKTIEKINIEVLGKPDVVFESPEVDDLVTPGSGFSTVLNFENIGTGTARNIKIVPESEEFVKLGSGQLVIDTLKPGENIVVPYSFEVSESVNPDAYSIPFSISFSDQKGNKYSVSQEIGVKVLHKAQLAVQNLKISPTDAKLFDPIDIQMRIENSGKGDAKNAKIVLETDLPGNKIAYLGKIDRGDDEPAIFNLQGSKAGDFQVNATYTFSDDFGEHSGEEIFMISVTKRTSSATLLIAALIVVAIILAIVRIRKKK